MKNKWIRRFVIAGLAIVVSLGLQTGILLFVRNFYLNSDSEVKITTNTSNNQTKDDVEIKIDANATDIKPSNGGKYLLYIVGETAHVVNFETGEDKEIDTVIDENTFLSWHDSDEKLIVSKTNEDGIMGITMYTYNPKTDSLEQALDYNNETRNYTLRNWNDKVSEIRINNVNTIIYLKMDTGWSNYIYKLNISDDTSKIQLLTNNIGEYRILKAYDEIFYEDLDTNKVYLRDKNQSNEVKVDGVDELKLLGLENNKVYVGKYEDNMISEIYYKDVTEGYDEDKEWTNQPLSESVKQENIAICKDGSIYVNNDLEGKVLNLENSKTTSYEGEFVSIINNKVISEHDSTIYRKSLK